MVSGAAEQTGRTRIQTERQRIIVAELRGRRPVPFAPWSSIDVLITDSWADDETVERPESLGPTVLRA